MVVVAAELEAEREPEPILVSHALVRHFTDAATAPLTCPASGSIPPPNPERTHHQTTGPY